MSVGKAQELKSLQVRITKAKAELKELSKDRNELNSRCSKLQNMIKVLEASIEKLTDKELIVSEHAIIRFMQYAMGLDIKQIENRILEKNLEATVNVTGDGKYPICEGLTAVVKKGSIVTITK